MIEKELSLKLLNKALAHGGEYADIFVEQREHTALVLEDSRLEKVVTGTESGAGVRLITQGKTVYAYTNDLSELSLIQAAQEVSKAATAIERDRVMDLETARPGCNFNIRLLPEKVLIEKKIDIVRKADLTARSIDHRIRQVTAVYRDSCQKITIATSDGTFAEDERIYTSALIQVIVEQDGTIQTGYESAGGFIGFELFENEDIEAMSVEAATRALKMLSARKAPAGRMPVVISSRAGGTMIHEAIGHGLESDLARQKLSVFSGKLGQQVASTLITVIDDATMPGQRGSFRFDDEGAPSQQTVLVEKGTLKGYLYDRLSALKEGRISTGNGRRESYRNRPIPRMTNTFISRGKTSPDLILSSVEQGLFVEKMGGGQVNTVTGDFVFDVQEGYLIERGMKGEPVRGATLSGNGPEILKAIDMVGDDLGFSIGTCGKDGQGVPVSDGMPTVRIPEIVVGGSYGT